MATGEVLLVLIEAFPNAKLADHTLIVYARLLKDLPDEILEAACLQHIATAKWFPTVAELREQALALIRIKEGRVLLSAMEAWSLVQAEIRRSGIYRTPEFSDPVVAEAVRRFGWTELCNQPLETLGVARSQFCKMYDALIEREQREGKLLPQTRQLIESFAPLEIGSGDGGEE